MAGIEGAVGELYSLEQLSTKNTAIHRLHPAVKLVTTLVLIVTMVSFPRHAFGRLAPFVFYPVFLMALAEVPYGMLFKRAMIAVPFCLFVGIANLVLERGTAFVIGGYAVTYGLLGLLTLVLRTLLCVTAVLILVATTPFPALTAALRQAKVPTIFVMMFEMTYRYIGVLLGEASSMWRAYALRGGGKGVALRHAGSFVGCLLLRSIDRAERIYAAMKCRGYAIQKSRDVESKPTTSDGLYALLVCGLCVLLRLVDIGAGLGAWAGGVH